MMTSAMVSRRSILRGLGVSLALPPLVSFAKGKPSDIPLRMGFTTSPMASLWISGDPRKRVF